MSDLRQGERSPRGGFFVASAEGPHIAAYSNNPEACRLAARRALTRAVQNATEATVLQTSSHTPLRGRSEP